MPRGAEHVASVAQVEANELAVLMLDARVHDAARASFHIDWLDRRDLRPTCCAKVAAVDPNARADFVTERLGFSA